MSDSRPDTAVSTDVSAQPFQLLAFIRTHRYTGLQTEADRVAEWFF